MRTLIVTVGAALAGSAPVGEPLEITGGKSVTVTITDCVALPPGPVQVME